MNLIYCLACTGANLELVFDLGKQTPVNNYDLTEKYPLAINQCADCGHVQLTYAVDPALLFGPGYVYKSGVAATMRAYYKDFAAKVRNFTRGNTLLEIGCNDLSQLRELERLGFECTGIDPSSPEAPNVKKEFFGAYPLKGTYDVIVAQNVLAHCPDPYEFLLNCVDVMHQDSQLYIQVSQANMMKFAQFDTIYHEHINFFSIGSFNKLAHRAGLRVTEAEVVAVHGHSFLFTCQLSSANSFKLKAEAFRKLFLKTIGDIKTYDGVPPKIVGYGASAKGINLLRYTGLNVDYIMEDTPAKQGKLVDVNGRRVPILPGDAFAGFKHVVYLPLAWNFFEELSEKIWNHYPRAVIIKFNINEYPHTCSIIHGRPVRRHDGEAAGHLGQRLPPER